MGVRAHSKFSAYSWVAVRQDKSKAVAFRFIENHKYAGLPHARRVCDKRHSDFSIDQGEGTLSGTENSICP